MQLAEAADLCGTLRSRRSWCAVVSPLADYESLLDIRSCSHSRSCIRCASVFRHGRRKRGVSILSRFAGCIGRQHHYGRAVRSGDLGFSALGRLDPRYARLCIVAGSYLGLAFNPARVRGRCHWQSLAGERWHRTGLDRGSGKRSCRSLRGLAGGEAGIPSIAQQSRGLTRPPSFDTFR
jgi:hypothetical protein